MVKHFNIIMAGVISGIVALFTSVLGVSGTIIGSVLSSFLYQLLSTYYEEKTQDLDLSKVKSMRKSRNKSIKENSVRNIEEELKLHRIVFIFPVVVILLIECLFCLTFAHYGFLKIFNLLESLTDQNLFRVMGLALIVVSFYPFIKPKVVKRSIGSYLFIIGALLLIRGLVDRFNILNKIFYLVFDRIDLLCGIIIIIALLIIVIKVLKDTFTPSNELLDENEHYNHARKINTHFDNFANNSNNYNGNNYGNYNDYNNYDDYQDYDDYAYRDNRNSFHGRHRNHDNYNDNSNHYPRRNNRFNNRNNQYNNDYVEESIPIYEEDYIYVTDPNNPNRTVKKRILKRINDDY